MENKNTLVVNLIGAPGTGKSTTMAGVFNKLKTQGIDCEMVTEFAKELVWEERQQTFKDELYLFAKQNHRLFRVNGKVDVIVTDRPLILSILYNHMYGDNSHVFDKLILQTHEKYNNVNILLKRVKEYQENGRNQTESEADHMYKEIKEILDFNVVDYFELNADEEVVDKITWTINEIITELEDKKRI